MAAKENLLTRTDDFITWFLPKIEKFPRNYKFLIGDRLVELQLDFLEQLIEAYYGKEKLPHLRRANVQLEKLRHLLQISTEMRFIGLQQLEYATKTGGAAGRAAHQPVPARALPDVYDLRAYAAPVRWRAGRRG